MKSAYLGHFGCQLAIVHAFLRAADKDAANLAHPSPPASLGFCFEEPMRGLQDDEPDS